MKLKEFIKKLERIAKEHGDGTEVIMADNLSVASVVFSKKYPSRKSAVIADRK